jgi:hypothetical protein
MGYGKESRDSVEWNLSSSGSIFFGAIRGIIAIFPSGIGLGPGAWDSYCLALLLALLYKTSSIYFVLPHQCSLYKQSRSPSIAKQAADVAINIMQYSLLDPSSALTVLRNSLQKLPISVHISHVLIQIILLIHE